MGNVVARYFEMWNTGDTSIAAEVLHPEWVDHAHPEVRAPDVPQVVERTRAALPDLRFVVDSILGDGDLIAVVGGADQGSRLSNLVWLVRLRDGRMAEMWTYHQR